MIGPWLRCLALGAGLLLAGCVAMPQRPAPPVPEPPPSPAPAPVVPTPAPATSARPESTPWQRLRERFVLDACRYSAEVERWARHYTRSPHRFAESWEPAMPFLLLVVDEIERRGLPGEFAMLPYVESRYRPLPSRGNLPAGMWQLMPATARDHGLRIGTDYDGRLDAIDSTRVALDLIERYDREFGDWRVATMAFNAGEFRLKRQLAGRDARSLDAAALARLGLNRITHEHLARMLALSCIVADPERYAVELPLPRPADRLVVQTFDAGIDLRVAARVSALQPAEFERFNAAQRGERSAAGAPARLLLPAAAAERFAATVAAHPGLLQMQWRSDVAARDTRPAELATGSPLAADAIAAANGVTVDATFGAGRELLVIADPRQPQAPPVASDVHVVTAGDTLSAIARRYRVHLSELLGWNSLRAKTILRLGMRLRVTAP